MKLYNKITPYSSIIILLLYPPIYLYRQEIKQGWESYKNNALNPANHGYVNAQKLYLLHAKLNSRNFFQKYTNIIFLNTHLVNDPYYRESTSLMLSDGKNKNLIQVVLPESPQKIIKKCNSNKELHEYQEGQCYILKIRKNKNWKNSIFLSQYKTTSLGKLKEKMLSKLGIEKLHKIMEIPIPQYTYSFTHGDYRYIIINLSPSWYSRFEVKEIK